MKRLARTALVCLAAAVAAVGCSSDPATDAPGDGKADNPGSGAAFVPNDNVVDRMGRAEVNNFLVRLPLTKADYNAADSFGLNLLERGAYQTLIRAAILFWDKLDGETHWGFGDRGTLAELYAWDFLVVDTSKACGVSDRTYMDIELAVSGDHTSCGGRTPNIDSIDELVSLMIGGPDALADLPFGDGIDASTAPATDSFPYLAAPFGK